MNKPEHVLVRYYENYDQYGVTTYYGAIDDQVFGGLQGTQPDWLTIIVNAGKIGGHGVDPTYPPPGYILWFRMDPATKALISFGRD